mmetsp:Transcript_5623/g.12451  ORF Transcript_5623/g.12451 Transcript_5623/m.12451 type:complete len:294 (-) Transcript_5623:764-1645(-)
MHRPDNPLEPSPKSPRPGLFAVAGVAPPPGVPPPIVTPSPLPSCIPPPIKPPPPICTVRPLPPLLPCKAPKPWGSMPIWVLLLELMFGRPLPPARPVVVLADPPCGRIPPTTSVGSKLLVQPPTPFALFPMTGSGPRPMSFPIRPELGMPAVATSTGIMPGMPMLRPLIPTAPDPPMTALRPVDSRPLPDGRPELPFMFAIFPPPRLPPKPLLAPSMPAESKNFLSRLRPSEVGPFISPTGTEVACRAEALVPPWASKGSSCPPCICSQLAITSASPPAPRPDNPRPLPPSPP